MEDYIKLAIFSSGKVDCIDDEFSSPNCEDPHPVMPYDRDKSTSPFVSCSMIVIDPHSLFVSWSTLLKSNSKVECGSATSLVRLGDFLV